MLQNDMGNTLIQDSKTGHIMGLSEGFVPVGLKEHGGIMYIVSADKKGRGEIGTIPSPVLKLELRSESLSQSKHSITTNSGPVSTMVGITDFKVYPGEKFMPAFQLIHSVSFVTREFTVQTVNGPKKIDLTERLISPVQEDVGCSHTGLYELKLFTLYGTQSTELNQVYKKPIRPYKTDGDLLDNNFWFLPYILSINDIDVEKTWLNKGMHTYPGNLPPGKLAIKAELEKIDSFDLPKISQSSGSKQQGTKAPYIKKENDGKYTLYFPGFEYKTHSIRFIGELNITLTNQASGEVNYESTLTNFATVDVDNKEYYYQIQKPGQSTYKKIDSSGGPQDDLSNYFAPLFSVSIGSKLKDWYRLEVKYKDIYGGDVDTFTYSFNPYHILNFDESYYGLTWSPKSLNLYQYYDPAKNADDVATSISTNSFKIPLRNSTTYITQIDPNFFTTSNMNPCKEKQIYSSSLNGASELKYLPIASGNTQNYEFKKTTVGANPEISIPAVNAEYLYTNSLFEMKPTNANTQLTITVTTDNNLIFSGDSITTIGITAPVLNGIVCRTPEDSVNDDYFAIDGNKWSHDPSLYTTAKGTVGLPTLYAEPTARNIPFFGDSFQTTLDIYDGMDNYNEAGKFTGSSTLAIQLHFTVHSTSELQWTCPLQNMSSYTIMTSFVLTGTTDEKSNIQLGLDKEGLPKEAVSLGTNLYQTSMPLGDPESLQNSTFEKDAYYYTETDKGSDTILDAGVYLITVDAGPDNIVKSYYRPTDGTTDKNIYGCNVDWDKDSTEPLIAAVIGDIPYQLSRIDSWCNGQHVRTFVPTLLYLPKQSIMRIEWKNIEKLKGIGIFRVTKPITFSDGSAFDDKNEVRVMYYQHPDLRDIILPLEATYYEQAECLGKTYDYYPGMQSLYATNRHPLIPKVQFCKAPEREGLWEYKNTDPTYLWDSGMGGENGDGLLKFIYQYNPEDPTHATSIPQIADYITQLEYRTLNTNL